MTRTALIAIILTLLMLLLVAGATMLFLWQGRAQLLTRLERVEEETAALNALVVETEGALATREAELATAVAVQATLTFERDENQTLAEERLRELNDVITERDRAQEELAELEGSEQAAPQVALFLPEPNNDAYPMDTPIEVLITASDPRGLAAVHLTVNGEPLESFEPHDEALFAASTVWTPEEGGEYLLSGRAINSLGRASEPITRTVVIIGGAEALVDLNAEQRARIEAIVSQLRGLPPLAPITPTLLTADDLRGRLEADLAEVTDEEARNDTLVLSAFDFLPPDFDLRSLLLELYAEQVAGFYDPETAEFVVLSEDDELDALEETVHAHEYVHALQDQHYELELVESETLDSEAAFALRALAEGDATLVQTIYLFARYLTLEEMEQALATFEEGQERSVQQLFAVLSGYLTPVEFNEILTLIAQTEVETEALDSAPPIVAAQLQFPYTGGLEFVDYLFAEGGFEAIDAAWIEPPRSTEQILHPERYLAGDEPQLVTVAPLTDTLGTGWQQIDQDIFGEFYLRQYLAQQLDEADVDAAATGWGGDRYAVYWREADGALVMILRLLWDTAEDAREFATLYPAYPTALFDTAGEVQPDGATCWEGADVICLYASDSETLLVRAPDIETAATIGAIER